MISQFAAEEWILTTAFCVGEDATFIEVNLGDYCSASDGLSVISNEFILHENYDDLSLTNNIALIKLPEPITFNGK